MNDAVKALREARSYTGDEIAKRMEPGGVKGEKEVLDPDGMDGGHDSIQEGKHSVTHTHEHEHADGEVHVHAHEHHFGHHHTEAHEPQHEVASFHGKSMKPGGGGRFAKGVADLEKKGKSEDAAKGIMAAAGRAKYGKEKFQKMGEAGRKRSK